MQLLGEVGTGIFIPMPSCEEEKTDVDFAAM